MGLKVSESSLSKHLKKMGLTYKIKILHPNGQKRINDYVPDVHFECTLIIAALGIDGRNGKAILIALDSFTEDDIRNWFKHDGYALI